MLKIALTISLAATAILLIRYIFTLLSKLYMRSQIILELDQMFKWFWNGTPEDRLYAWYKVRMVLKQREGNTEQKKVARVDKKIIQLNKDSMYSDVFVDRNGKLVSKDLDVTIKK